MATIGNSPHGRHFGLRREALTPSAIALFIVIAGNIWIALALSGFHGAQRAGASPGISVDMTSTAGATCSASTEEPTTVGRGMSDAGEQWAPFTLGFLIFEQPIESSSTSAFGPLPTCSSSRE